MIQLSKGLVDQILTRPGTADALRKYVEIQEQFDKVDVTSDPDFQRRFVAFYRVRRGPDWRTVYFNLLKEGRSRSPSFRRILEALREGTGRVEASFASKLVATCDPEQPVIDSVVLGHLRKRLPYAKHPARLQMIHQLHEDIRTEYAAFLRSKAGRDLVGRFENQFGNVVSRVKMLDLVLWQHRSSR